MDSQNSQNISSDNEIDSWYDTNSMYPTINASGTTSSISYGPIGTAYITLPPSGANGAYSASGASTTFTSSGNNSLHVKGDATFDGDIKWKGRSLGDMFQAIEERLAILVPDPEKLEHFEALKKAYEHYKVLEALCQVPKKEESK